jgi:hypothetical protein
LHYAEDVLYSGDHVLIEREGYPEHGDHLPDHGENNLKACDHLLHLPNQGRLHKDYGRRQQEHLRRSGGSFLALTGAWEPLRGLN